jgi:uncharacterized pyridoxamine 5'-phosphate oxidase family protein
MKKSVLLIIALFLVFNLSSCLFEEHEVENFVIQDPSVKSIIFSVESSGFTNTKNFFITDEEYVYIAKEYNERIVYKKLLENRNFKFIGLNNNKLFVENMDGLQKIVFNDIFSKSPTIEEDVLVSYYLNGFNELIIGQNTDVILDINVDKSVLDDLDPSVVIGFIKDAKKVDTIDSSIVYKTNYYVYFNNNQFVLRTVINNDQIVDITDTYIDITDVIKKVIFVDEYAYLISENKIYTYSLKTGLISSLEFNNILSAKQLDNYICVATSNSQLEIYDTSLNRNTSIDLGDNKLLGYNWYSDGFDSGVVYVYQVENKIKINFTKIE